MDKLVRATGDRRPKFDADSISTSGNACRGRTDSALQLFGRVPFVASLIVFRAQHFICAGSIAAHSNVSLVVAMGMSDCAFLVAAVPMCITPDSGCNLERHFCGLDRICWLAIAS